MKRKYSPLLGLTIFILIFISTPVLAESKPIQLAFFTPVQIFPENDTISGVRINLLYGRNASVTGLDLGLVNHTTAGLSKGIQYGAVVLADSDFIGIQFSWVNVTRGNFEGFQIGFINFAKTMNGLQFGLVNIISQGGAFPVFPIVNWSF
jgi:hypothetical protein